jgi:uncharacterized protein (DUF488 family)
MSKRIYTIGHSTRQLDELIDLLKENSVTKLADIRRFPGSRRHPHFSREALSLSLPAHAIAYEHFEDLGGRRKARKDSENSGMRSEQFRGYADYMATPEFRAAIERLLDTTQRTAYMCAEAVPWQCHRNLLSDDLIRRGIEVIHILGPGSVRPHALSKDALVLSDRVTYPARQGSLLGGR